MHGSYLCCHVVRAKRLMRRRVEASPSDQHPQRRYSVDHRLLRELGVLLQQCLPVHDHFEWGLLDRHLDQESFAVLADVVL